MVLVGVGTFFAQAAATGFVSTAATVDRGAASGIYLACYFLGGLVGTAVARPVVRSLRLAGLRGRDRRRSRDRLAVGIPLEVAGACSRYASTRATRPREKKSCSPCFPWYVCGRGNRYGRRARKSGRPSGTQMADEDAIEADLTGSDLLPIRCSTRERHSREGERDTFGLHGFLPPHIGTLDEQISRRLERSALAENRLRALCLPARAAGCQRDPVLRAAHARISRRRCRSSTRPRSAKAANASATSGRSRAACS